MSDQEDSLLIDEESSRTPTRDLPSLVCPYSGKEAQAREVVEQEGAVLVRYAANSEHPFFVPFDIADQKESISHGVFEGLRRLFQYASSQTR